MPDDAGRCRPAPVRDTRGVDDSEPRPIEILVFRVDPADVERFVAIDDDVWTVGLRTGGGLVAKEIWLDDDRPGEVTVLIWWASAAAWSAAADTSELDRLTAEFDRRFGRPYELVRAVHEERPGLHRIHRSAPG